MTTNSNRARWPYEPRVMSDEQIEAAHAASEVDDDPRPMPGAGPVVWLALGAAVLGLVVLALHFAARMGWLT